MSKFELKYLIPTMWVSQTEDWISNIVFSTLLTCSPTFFYELSLKLKIYHITP